MATAKYCGGAGELRESERVAGILAQRDVVVENSVDLAAL